MVRIQKSTLAMAMAFLAVTLACANAQERPRRGQAVPGKEAPHPPQVGDMAPSLELKNLDGDVVSLKKLNAEHPVVLLVLRGWPGYQCPICSRQVGDVMAKNAQLMEKGAEVILVYPGPADLLTDHAREFQGDRNLPANFHYVTDPDYTFTNAWGLRWEAERETAYPSTFVIGTDHKIKFGKTSTSHGDRSSADEVIEQL